MSSKDRLTEARALIAQKRYAEARALLEQIDHPVAREWVSKLERLAPRRPALKPAPTLPLRAQLEVVRDLIGQRRYDAARLMLAGMDHPTARDWLAKLDRIAPAVPAPETIEPPLPEPPPIDALPREVQEERLIAAQELILENNFEAASAILARLSIPQALIWQDKTQMNKLREFQSLWLDLYYYAPPDDQPPDWRCEVCGRDRSGAPGCPQRGGPPCPLRLHERPIDDPHRLALIVGSIYMEQTGGLQTLLKDVDAAQLGRWCSALELQLRGLWARDVRRPALESALMTLRALEQTRRLTTSGRG